MRLCWEHIVDKWFTPEWQEKHNARRERRLLMGGPSHHQGSMSNEEYRVRWSATYGDAECPEFMGWALARKVKASEVTYNLDDAPSSAYNNPSVYSCMTIYTEAQLVEERRLPELQSVEGVRHQEVVQTQVNHIFSYIQSLYVKFGEAIPPLPPVPPMIFTLAPAPATPNNQSAASNTPEMSPAILLTMPPQQLFPPPLPFDPPQ